MANKQNDPIYDLAETIIDSAQQIANSRTDKAAYDKSYSSSILGINRAFTDDVNDKDKTSIIQKFAIPETHEDGDPNYYIFKINGTYYCAKQNGDFKLYDRIMVYIPNGDWSRMYFDYDTAVHGGSGGGGGGDTYTPPNYTVSPDAPGGEDPQEGNLWIVTNSDEVAEFSDLTSESFVEMHSYKSTGENETLKWQKAKTVVSKNSSDVDTANDDYWIRLDNDDSTIIGIYKWTTEGATVFYQIYPTAERGTAPNVYISFKKPMNEGDYWVDIDNYTRRNIEALNIYRLNDDASGYEWEVVYRVKGGGVGENLYPYSATAERFNDYSEILLGTQGFDYNDPTGGSFSTTPHTHLHGYHNYDLGSGSTVGANTYEGQHNFGNNCLECTFSGSDNKGTSCQRTNIGGSRNQATGCVQSDISGENNTVTGIRNATVQGLNNDISCTQAGDISRAIFCGNGLRVRGSIYDALIIAQGDINVTAARACIFAGTTGMSVQGTINRVIGVGDVMTISGTTRDVAVFGSNHTVTSGIEGLVAGYGCTLSGRSGIVLGRGGIIDANNPYVFVVGRDAGSGNGLAMDFSGNVYAAGTYGTLGADIAETYEWADGNPDGEDRRGLFVTLDGENIKLVNSDDDYILGVVSATPSFCGDTYDLYWRGKYKTDVFGAVIYGEDGKPVISDDFDEERKYIPQSQRKEKSRIATNGKVIIIDDGTCLVNHYCKPSDNGIGTYSDNKNDYRVIKRIDETHVKIVLK